MKVLLVQEDGSLSEGLSLSLIRKGYTVDLAHSQPDAYFAVSTHLYDLVIVDFHSSNWDGLSLIEQIKKRGLPSAVLAIAARNGIVEQLESLGLNFEVLAKPFELKEFEHRIHSLMLNASLSHQTQLTYGPLILDLELRTASARGADVHLSAREKIVLEMLMRNSGKLVNREKIHEALLAADVELTNNALDIVLHRLRKKIAVSGCSIRTMRGLGYTIR
jgi:two-component system, OmpR family, response regulator